MQSLHKTSCTTNFPFECMHNIMHVCKWLLQIFNNLVDTVVKIRGLSYAMIFHYLIVDLEVCTCKMECNDKDYSMG